MVSKFLSSKIHCRFSPNRTLFTVLLIVVDAAAHFEHISAWLRLRKAGKGNLQSQNTFSKLVTTVIYLSHSCLI